MFYGPKRKTKSIYIAINNIGHTACHITRNQQMNLFPDFRIPIKVGLGENSLCNLKNTQRKKKMCQDIAQLEGQKVAEE